MIIKKRLLLILPISFIVLIVLALVWHVNAQKRQEENIQVQERILSYVTIYEGQEFDYIHISKQLNLSHEQLFEHLLQLNRAGKIVAVQKYLRKPILLTKDDCINYYWKVFLTSDEHPHSELGTLSR